MIASNMKTYADSNIFAYRALGCERCGKNVMTKMCRGNDEGCEKFLCSYCTWDHGCVECNACFDSNEGHDQDCERNIE